MSQKKNNQDIINNIVKQTSERSSSVSKFMQALQESVIEGLQTDGNVKIDGFGTFSTVRVASREGVNISNGEKITVPEFTKFSFVPQFKSLAKMTKPADDGSGKTDGDALESSSLQMEEGEVVESEEAASDDAAAEVTGIPAEEDIIVEEPGEMPDDDDADDDVEDEPEQKPVKEKPADHFSGIDVLISTPESLEETRDRLAAAIERQSSMEEQVRKAREAFEQAQLALEQSQTLLSEAQEDVNELSQIMENVEMNRKAMIDNGEEEPEEGLNTEEEDNPEPSSLVAVKPQPVDSNKENDAKPADATPKHPRKKTLLYIAAAAVACVAIILLSLLFCSKSSDEKSQANTDQQKENAGVTKPDSATQAKAMAAKKDSLEKDSVEKALSGKRQLTATTITRVDTVVFDGTEYLEHIVTNHYGEHDMVYKVIQFNRKHGLLNDLNHIPIGSNILLPHYE